jgi:PAS domain S-box-containing protein
MPPQPTSRRPGGGPADGSLAPPDHETLLKAVVEGVVDSVVTINEAGIIQWCNPATVRLFGYELDALIGQNVSMLMPPPGTSMTSIWRITLAGPRRKSSELDVKCRVAVEMGRSFPWNWR